MTLAERTVEGDLARERQSHDEEYRRAELQGDIEAMAHAVLGTGGGMWVHELRGPAGSALHEARLRQVLSRVPEQSGLAVRLRVRLAAEHDYRTGQYSMMEIALDEARLSADPMIRAEALGLAHHCVLGPGHVGLRQSLAAELMAEGARSGRHHDLLLGALWHAVNGFLAADPHAERHLNEVRGLLAEGPHLAVRFVANALEVTLAIRAGRLDDAQRLASECARSGTAAGDPDASGWYGAQLLAIRWYQGRVAELAPFVEAMLHSPTLSAVDNAYFAAMAVAAASAGDRRRAEGALARLCGNDLADLPRSSSWLVTMNGVVEAAHLLGDGETAARAYDLLEPFAHLPMMASLGVACFGSVHQALGVAAMTAGDPNRAVTHFAAAVQRNLALGHWPAVALSRQRYGQALAVRSRREDAALVRQTLAAAADEAARMGLVLPTVDDYAAGSLRCVKRGRSWYLSFGQRSVTVDHSVGMLHLAVLIANPGTEIAATDLVAGVGAVLGPNSETGRGSVATPLNQTILDTVAIRHYRDRLAELDGDDDATPPTSGAGEARNEGPFDGAMAEERRWLLAQLAGGVGIAGRLRTFNDTTERARLAVGKAIRRALERIEARDAVIGAHLRHRVRTGIRCCYEDTAWTPSEAKDRSTGE